jgi:hypothetical protein
MTRINPLLAGKMLHWMALQSSCILHKEEMVASSKEKYDQLKARVPLLESKMASWETLKSQHQSLGEVSHQSDKGGLYGISVQKLEGIYRVIVTINEFMLLLLGKMAENHFVHALELGKRLTSKPCTSWMALLEGVTSASKIPEDSSGNKDPEKDLQRWKKNWCNPGKYYCKCRGPRDAVYSSFCEDCFQARLWDHEENDIDAECHPQLVFSRKKIAFLLGRESNREHHRKALEGTSTLERLYVTISRIHLNTLYPRPSE